MSEHTPGPWEYRYTVGAGLEIFGNVSSTFGEDFGELVNTFGLGACQPPRFQIAYARWVQFPKREWDEMQEANARLIAAAPELLEALEGVVSRCRRDGYVGTDGQFLKVIEAVIAKAKTQD